jgi:uncharacterized lipoprotein YddW (UPF0748 family)
MKRHRLTLAGLRRLLIGLALTAIVQIAATEPRAQRTEYRGFWVDTFNTLLDTDAQVQTVIAQARQAEANAIFVQIRRRGDSWYVDSLEPRADRRPTWAPGFDPLQSLINYAHNPPPGGQPLEVHAFVIIGSIWNRDPRCPTLQAPAGHAFLTHGAYDPVSTTIDPTSDDNWLTRTLLPDTGPHQTTCQTGTPPNISFNGQRIGAEFWIDLGHPEAAKYTNEVLMHLVEKYDIDGLHLDRIRYPEFTATGQTPANGTNIGYNKTSVARFNTRYGRTGNPAINDPLWSQWRRNQVSNLVRRLYLNAISRKPQIKISAALIAFGGGPKTEASWNSAEAYWRVYQDWRAWTEEGILDLAIPMAYKAEHTPAQVTQFDQWNEWTKNHQYNRGALVGVGGLSNAVEGTLRQTRRVLLVPSTQGKNALGVNFYSMFTNNIAVTSNPFRLPTAGSTPLRPFADFALGLTTGKSGTTFFEDPVANPTAVFADTAPIPVLQWKSAPLKGHIMGFAKRGNNTPLDTADVTITNIDSNAVRAGATDGGGFYGGVDLVLGQYLVKAVLGPDTLYSCVANVQAGLVTTADVNPETTAPTTMATLNPAAPNGSNGWYTSNVELSLSAFDNCTGVAKTEYSTDGGASWTTYSGTVVLDKEGVNSILFRSIDRAGNVEANNSVTIKIDKTAPTIQLTAKRTRIWPPNGQIENVDIDGSGSDAVSGVAQVSYVVTDEYGSSLSIAPRALSGSSANWAETLAVEARREGTDLNGRLYTVTATITDVAGLTSTATITVVVAHDQRP